MTKGSIFLHAALSFRSSLVFLAENFTANLEVFCFITPVGYPLHLRRDLKFLMFSSNVSFVCVCTSRVDSL